MIFYFTGTGNSLFMAKKLLADGERLVSIADALNNGEYEYQLQEGEPVGFVFPVYFYTLPTLVSKFADKVKLSGTTYTYAVITCGGGIGQSGAVLKKKLAQRGVTLNYVQEALMPDNSMLFYQIPPVSESAKRLANASELAEKVKSNVAKRKPGTVGNSTWISSTMGLAYKACTKTKKFYADDKCTGCGMCERNCPEKVIHIEDGKPKWTKPNCGKCSACINRCPASAIQYGRMTQKRNRYAHPDL